jgi:hypothetical protein
VEKFVDSVLFAAAAEEFVDAVMFENLYGTQAIEEQSRVSSEAGVIMMTNGKEEEEASFKSAGRAAVEWLAACDLQCAFRGLRARRAMTRAKYGSQAADASVVVQCAWRCYRARLRVFFVLASVFVRMATRIQTCFRKHQATSLLIKRKALVNGTPLFVVFHPTQSRKHSGESPDSGAKLYGTNPAQSKRKWNMQEGDPRDGGRSTTARITLEDADTYLSNALIHSQTQVKLSPLNLMRAPDGQLRTAEANRLVQTSASIFSTSFTPLPPSRLLPPLELPTARAHERVQGMNPPAHSNFSLEDVVDYVGELWEKSIEELPSSDFKLGTGTNVPSLVLVVLPVQQVHMFFDSANWHPETRALGELVLLRSDQEVRTDTSVCACAPATASEIV